MVPSDCRIDGAPMCRRVLSVPKLGNKTMVLLESKAQKLARVTSSHSYSTSKSTEPSKRHTPLSKKSSTALRNTRPYTYHTECPSVSPTCEPRMDGSCATTWHATYTRYPSLSTCGTTLSAIGVKGKTVSDLLCSPKLTCTVNELQKQGCRPCNCAQLARRHGLPLVDGHAVIRKPKHARAVFGNQAAIVLQDIRNEAIPSWYEARGTLLRSIRNTLRTLPVQTDTANSMYSECLSHLKSAWHVERRAAPWFTLW